MFNSVQFSSVKHKCAFTIFALIFAITLMGCPKPDEEVYDVTQVLITELSAITTSVGNTITLTATSSPDNISADKFTWTSNDTEIATVNSVGVVTGVGEGKVEITARYGDYFDYVVLTITKSTSQVSVPAGFVVVPAASIDGTESWTPSSSIFVSGRALEIASFYMCEHEVTQDEYNTVMESLPSDMATTDGTAGSNPVNKVSWYSAIAYCNKRSINDGLTPCYSMVKSGDGATETSTDPDDWGTVPTSSDSRWNAVTCDFTADGYRLPTEAEWEWAARGGQISGTTYAGSGTIGDVAWYGSNSDDKTHEVGTKDSNAYGLYDMSGNVWEWCYDWYSDNLSSTSATGPASGTYRMIHGGSYSSSSADDCTVSKRRFDSYPYSTSSGVGFRVVRGM